MRQKAEFIYNKFKAMFLIGEGENFSMVFNRDVIEYQKAEKERQEKEARGEATEAAKGEAENKENLETTGRMLLVQNITKWH